MQEEIIQINNVRFGFTNDPIISDFSMIAKKGEWITFIGPSGSGKTTLLNLIAGILLPQAGDITVCGQSLGSLSHDAREHFRLQNIAIVFQDIRLLGMWSVFENVWMILYLQGWTRESAMEAAYVWLGKVGIIELIDRSIDSLSGGQKQRVAIARAMAKAPTILLADEPTGSLDQKNTSHVLGLMRELCHESKTTLLCVTHDPEVKSFSDQIVTSSEWYEA
jgi:ABC-type lipoprotein export system ATPase subunit